MAPPPNAALARAALAALAADGGGGARVGGPCETAAVAEPPATRPARRRIARARADEQIAQIERILPERGLHFQHHVVLVQLREHGGDFALAVGVVERLVDGGGRDAQARGGVAVEHQPGAQTLHLLVAGHIASVPAAPAAGPASSAHRCSARRRWGLPGCTGTACG